MASSKTHIPPSNPPKLPPSHCAPTTSSTKDAGHTQDKPVAIGGPSPTRSPARPRWGAGAQPGGRGEGGAPARSILLLEDSHAAGLGHRRGSRMRVP